MVFEFRCETGAISMASCDDVVGVLWEFMGRDWVYGKSGLVVKFPCFGEKWVLGSICVMVSGGDGVVVF